MKKDFPPQLIDEMAACYQDDAAIQRQHAAVFAIQTFDLSEDQQICMIYSPYLSQGEQLELWLSQQKIALDEAAIRDLLEQRSEDLVLAQQLTQLSGLTLTQMRHCHGDWGLSPIRSLC